MSKLEPIYFAPQPKPGGGWICFKDSPSPPPPPPNYAAAAQAQGQSNLDAARATAKLSNPNIVNPYGSQTVSYGDRRWVPDASTATPNANPFAGSRFQSIGQGLTDALPTPTVGGHWEGSGDPDVGTVTQSLSPSGQKLFGTYQGVNQKLGDVAGQGVGYVQNMLDKPFDQSKLPSAPVSPGQSYTQAAFSRLQPNIDQERSMLETQLSNQGIDRSSNPVAYENAKRMQDQRENDQRAAITTSSVGQDQAARQAAIQEQSFMRNEPLNTLNAVRSAAPVGIPQFQGYSGSQVAAAPVFGATQAQGQYDQGIYNANVASTNANNSSMTGLLGAGATAAAIFF